MSGGPSDSGWKSPFTESVPDEKAVRAKKVRNGLILLAVVAVVVFAAGWNPPTKTVHKFTKASDYNPERESGCTNSGKGCHGEDKTRSDFNKYHPDAKCTTCHDYQGVGCIPCHMPKEKECQLCHDGTMKKAPDVVKLTDSYPKGHYRETTHTAMGTEFEETMTAAADGQAGAKCSDCHSRDLRKAHTEVPVAEGSTYGPSIGCGECHNDERAEGLKQVEAKWKGRACADCHKKDTSAPQHATDVAASVEASGALSCGSTGAGCHNVNDLHALHKNMPKNCAGSAEDGEKSCHVLGAEAAKPTAITCGGSEDDTCHRLYVNDTYSHKQDTTTHSPTSTVPASDTSFYDTACGDCHNMAADGTSLNEEHALATSSRSTDAENPCTNCHNNPAALSAVQDKWTERNTTGACEACHGSEGLASAHEGDLAGKHQVSSAGCSDSGPGCHPTNDYMEVGEPTTSANIHRDCLRCHDRTASDGNQAYDPSATTCGQGRDCHSGSGDYVPSTGEHDGAAGAANGADKTHHTAGSDQAKAEWVDSATGSRTACNACHSMQLGGEHARSNSSIAKGAGTECKRCHNADTRAASIVKSDWIQQDSKTACKSCHADAGKRPIHGAISSSHAAEELNAFGAPAAGMCVTSGCHATLDLRVLHESSGCTTPGCHQDSGNIFGRDLKGCGGFDTDTSCHAGYSALTHFADHAADKSGTVEGITYRTGENVGCFGCHNADLQVEHENARLSGQLDGTSSNSCGICHAGAQGASPYASLSAVKNAIANHDKRCSACHASGTKLDGGSAVASAHKDISMAMTLPAGKVWSDPFGDWRAAFDSPTGGGHNVLTASLVGGKIQKRFPLTEFSIEGTTYAWALPPNSGQTAWLKASAFDAGATETTSSIQHIKVLCSDCHGMSAEMAGPHGSAIRVFIDPAYSQTAYADPTRTSSQFEATGTNRVVCFKCHQIYVGGISGSDAPGGASLHARHVDHPDLGSSSKHRHGEACVDCHVRIPHAWRRPRMLIRTIETSDGATPDAYPYVLADHDGLLGVRLRSFDPQTQLRSGSCVTGGCHPGSSPTRHPEPSDVPTATYWP